MKVRGRIILTGILSITVGSVACYGAMAQDKTSMKDGAAPESGFETWGDIEFGGRWYIERPREIGRAWVTPSRERPDPQSIAKFEEYGKVPEGAYLERLNVGGQTKDAEYFVDLRATDVGNNNQRYIFDWGKTGDISGTVSWDQIPHLYSTSAQSIWNGAGTTNLTTNVDLSPLSAYVAQGTVTAAAQFVNNMAVFQSLGGGKYAYAYNACVANPTGCVTGRDIINQQLRDNLKVEKIGIQRDKFETDNRWTPTPEWEFRAGYSTERREGTQLAGTNWGGGGGPETVQVIRPVGDTTQNGKASGERMGEWAFGKYNVKLTGSISTFDNDFSSFTVQNPYMVAPDGCNTAVTQPTGAANALVPCSRISLMPSNQAYTVNLTSGIDLPFHSRFMNTVQYTTMRQDDPFQDPSPNTNHIIGVAGTPIAGAPLPGTLWGGIRNAATSLNGEIDTLLVNSALSTQITPDLKSTLRYRYYDFDNQTPVNIWNWVTEDGGVGAVRRNFGYSRSQQNASADLTYRVLKNTSIGGSTGWEEINRDKREALRTDEYIGKVFGDSRIDNVGTFRASYQYSERRYDAYDPASFYRYLFAAGAVIPGGINGGGGSNSWGLRKMDLADRDREKGMVLFQFDNIPFVPNLSLTPSAGFRNDKYGTDPNRTHTFNLTDINGIPIAGTATVNEYGLLKDDSWNAGIEAAYTFRPGTALVLSYMRESFNKDLAGNNGTTSNTNTGAVPAVPSRWFSNMKEDVDTFIVGTNIALNDQFDFSASYSIAFGKENWTAKDMQTSPCSFAPGTTQFQGGCIPFPSVNTNLQRVDAILKYKFDSEAVNKFGFQGDVYWKLKYSWDHMRVDNWQNDYATPYMYYVDPTPRAYNMAAYNPNYEVHAVATSINFKW
jgi:hypothetical protein